MKSSRPTVPLLILLVAGVLGLLFVLLFSGGSPSAERLSMRFTRVQTNFAGADPVAVFAVTNLNSDTLSYVASGSWTNVHQLGTIEQGVSFLSYPLPGGMDSGELTVRCSRKKSAVSVWVNALFSRFSGGTGVSGEGEFLFQLSVQVPADLRRIVN